MKRGGLREMAARPLFADAKNFILSFGGARFAQALLHKIRFPVHNRDSRQETKPRARPQTD